MIGGHQGGGPLIALAKDFEEKLGIVLEQGYARALQSGASDEKLMAFGPVVLDLLKRAAKLLKPGGVLVYSTCSLETEENEEVIETFLKIHRHYRQETARMITPMKDGVDGAFVARLRCEASAVEQPVSRGEIVREHPRPSRARRR